MNQYPNFPNVDNVPPTQSSTIGYPQTGYQPGQVYPQGYPQQPFQQPGAFTQPSLNIPQVSQVPQVPQIPFFEQSYIENILRLNRGKIATVYMNFENSQWGSKIFKGVIEAAGKDHLILSDPVTGMRYLLLTIYLNYVTFDEEISYEYPFAAIPQSFGTQSPIFNVPTQQPSTQFRKKDVKVEEK